MSSRSPKLSLQAKRGEYIAPLQPSARTRRTKPGESIVKPWPRELLDDCGRNTEMLWRRWRTRAIRPLATASTSVAAAQPQNRRRILELPWPAWLLEGLHEITARACSGVGSISSVEYSIDGGEWREAEMQGPNIAHARVRFSATLGKEPEIELALV